MAEDKDREQGGSGPEKPRGVFGAGRGPAASGRRGAFAKSRKRASREERDVRDREPGETGREGSRDPRESRGRSTDGRPRGAEERESRESREQRAVSIRSRIYPPPRREPRRPFLLRFLSGTMWIVLVLIAAALGAMLGLGLFDRVLMPKVVRLGDEVVIPPVAGLEVEEAEALLRSLGLRPVRAAGRHHPAVPGGAVLEVSPPVGLEVKRDRQVFLTPSLGGLNLKIPDVVGLSQRLAEVKLSASGLRIREVREAATALAPPGQVLALSPQAGSNAPATSDVAVLISRRRAPTPFLMPDLTGRPGMEAARWLRARGFQVDRRPSDLPGRPGAVQEQSPEPGTAIWPGTSVRLSVTPARQDRYPRRFPG